jgi:hypothetical protein
VEQVVEDAGQVEELAILVVLGSDGVSSLWQQ